MNRPHPPVAKAPLLASAATLERGDVLLTDSYRARILRVAAGTGRVTVFSPRHAGQSNLLESPFEIAIDPFGAAWVTDAVVGNVIRIDPLTGSQSRLQLCANPISCVPYQHSAAGSIEVRLSEHPSEIHNSFLDDSPP